MRIGNYDYNEQLKLLSFSNFKKFWNDGEADRVGMTAEEAAKVFEIKVPVKNKKGS